MKAVTEPIVEAISHRFLGAMRRLTIVPGVAFDLTPQEATILSRAMNAVCADHGRVDEIFMSPNGADKEFLAKVTDEGLLVVDGDVGLLLEWPQVAAIAEALPG